MSFAERIQQMEVVGVALDEANAISDDLKINEGQLLLLLRTFFDVTSSGTGATVEFAQEIRNKADECDRLHALYLEKLVEIAGMKKA